MTDVTVTTQPPAQNPLASPDPGPLRSPTGEILPPGSKPPPTDSSSTTQPTTTKSQPTSTADPASTKDGDKSAINNGEQKPPEATGAPETYADFTAPEGFEIDKEAISKALPIFKELNLSQKGAQKLVDFYAEASRQAAEAPFKLWAETQKEWKDEVAARFGKDMEPGGKVATAIAKVIDAHLPPTLAKNFRAVLDFTGAGNHPDYIEGFATLAKLLGEGTSVRGNGPTPASQAKPGEGPKSIAQAMYPHLPSAATGA